MHNKQSEFIETLLASMRLEDKLGQMMQLAAREESANNYIERYRLGSYLHAIGDRVQELNELNKQKSSLNIPLVFGIDAIHGHCFENQNTVFPVQLASACSWNTELIKQVGEVTAREAQASGLHWTFSPVLCIARDPRWGRTSETFGEDPLLIGKMATALVEGLQSTEQPFAACAKHYAAYGETDGARDAADAHVSERQLRTVFLPPFKAMVDAGCMSFMAGYQSLNGIPISANTWLMNTVLREEWGYEGVVVTDWNNVGQMLLKQGAARDMKEAVALCLDASNDIIMSTHDFFDCARELVHEGRISESRIDESVRRILNFKYKLGLFEAEKIKKPKRKQVLANNSRWDLALEAARQSLVLLKNDKALPLEKNKVKNILLVGENSRDILAQLGDWAFMPGVQIYKDHTTHRSSTTTLKKALEEYCEENNIGFSYFGSCGPLETSKINERELLAAAEHADQILFCVGDTLREHGEFHDRANLQLSGNQLQALSILKKSTKPLISIALMSKPLTLSELAEYSPAVLLAFNPGSKGGTAITECLFGEINPCGKLPISFPRHEGQLPVYYYQSPGWHASYCPLYENTESYIDLPPGPLFHFGEGLNYSEIFYQSASLSETCIKENQQTTLSFTLENKGVFDAVEIVQLYVRQVMPGVTTPKLRLIDFKRVKILAGDKENVELNIRHEDIRYLSRNMKWKTPSGEAFLYIGKSSKEEDLQQLTLQVL